MDLLKLQEAIKEQDPERDILATLAKRVKSSRAYLSQIAYGHRKPSPKMCEKLVEAEPRLTFQDLRPDIYRKVA